MIEIVIYCANVVMGLQLDTVIDLVIPRGSNKLVSQIKESTKIPVLGHAGEKKCYNHIHWDILHKQ